MANSVGSVYFDLLPKFDAIEKKIDEYKKKQQEIKFKASVKSADLNKQITAIKSKSNNLVFKALFDAANLQSQVNRATAGIDRTVRISANVSASGVKQLQSSLNTVSVAFGNTISDAISTAANTALDAAKSITSAGVGFASESAKSYADVNTQINILSQKIGATVSEQQSLERAITSTAAKTALLPKDAGALADNLANAGLNIRQINSLLQPIAIGSAGLGRSVTGLSSDITTLSAAFDLDVESQGATIVNAIASTATSADLTADSLASSIRYFRSQQKGIEGISNTFGAIALAAAGGIQGSSSGTSLNALITQSIKNADKVKEIFDVDVKTADGSLKSELQLIRELREAYNLAVSERGSANALQDATSLFQTRGSRVLSAISRLSDQTINETLSKVNRFTSEDIVGDLGAASLQGLGGAFLSLENTIASLQFSLGSKIAPAVEAVVRSITTIISTIANNEALLNSIGESAQRFADALNNPEVQAALVRVGEILGGLIQQGVNFLADKLESISRILTEQPQILEQIAQTISGLVAGTFELIAGLVQIGLLIARAVAPLISVRAVIDTVKIAVNEVIKLASTFFTALNAGLSQGQLSVNTLQTGIRTIGSLLQPVAALFGGVYGSVIAIASEVLKIVNESGLLNFTNTLTQNITTLFGQINSTLPGIVRTIGTAFTSFSQGLSQGVGRVNLQSPDLQLPELNIADAAMSFGESVGEIGARIFNVVSRISEIVVNNIVPALLRIGEALAPVANSLLTTVFDLVSKLLPLIEKAINLTIGFITNNLPGLQQFLLSAVDIISKVSGFIIGIITNLIRGIEQSGIIQKLWQQVAGFVSQLVVNAKAIFETITTNLSGLEGLQKLVQGIAGFVATIVSGVLLTASNLARASASATALQGSFGAIVGFVDEQAGKLGSFFESITGVVEKLEFLPRLGQSAQTIFGNLSDGLNAFITTFVDKARPALDPVFKAVEEAAPKILNLILKLGEWAAQFSVVFKPVGEFVGTVLGNALVLTGKILANLISTVGKVAEFISTNERIQEIINFVTKAVSFIFGTLTSVSNTLTAITSKVIETVYPVLEFITLGVVKILNTISNIGFTALTTVIGKLQEIGDWFQGLIDNYVPAIQKAAVAFWALLVEKWTAFYTPISEWFTTTLPEAIAATYTRITDTVNLIGEAITKFFAGIITWISDTFAKAITSAYEFLTNTIKAVGDFVASWFQFVISWITETFFNTVTQANERVNTAIQSVGNFVSEWFNYVFVWITDTFTKTVQATQEYVSATIKFIGDTITSWFNFVIDWLIKTFGDTVTKTYEFVMGWINALIKNVQSWFDSVLTWLFKTLPETVSKTYESVMGWVNLLIKNIASWFDSIIRFFTETIPNAIKAFYDKVMAWVQQFAKYISEWFASIAKWFSDTYDFLISKLTGIKDFIVKQLRGEALGGIYTAAKNVMGIFDGWGKSLGNTLGTLNNIVGKAAEFAGGAVSGAVNAITGGGSSPKGANTEAIKAALGGRPVTLGSNEQIFNQAGLGTPLVTTVKAFENFYSRAYADGRQTSIGFGTKARSANETITVENANIRLRDELLKARKEVEDIVVRGYGRQLNQGQLDALTSFAYNLGGGALRQLFDDGRRSNAVVAEKIKLYNKADLLDGKGMRVLEGLRIRRNFESDMFKGLYSGVSEAAAANQKQATEVNNLLSSFTNAALSSADTASEVGQLFGAAASISGFGDIKLPTLRSNTLPGLQNFGAPRSGGTRKHAGFDTDHANDATSVVQALLGGEILRVATQRDSRGRLTGYGNYIDIYNKALGVVERIAEFDKRVFTEADVGKTIKAGTVVGRGTTFRGVDHREIRNIAEYRRQPFGFDSARDPAAFLVGLDLYRKTAQGSLVPTGKSISQQVRSGYGGAVDTIAQATEISNRVLQSVGGVISTQAIADFTEDLALSLQNIETAKLTERTLPDVMLQANQLINDLRDDTGLAFTGSQLTELQNTLAEAIGQATGLNYNAQAPAQAQALLAPAGTSGTSTNNIFNQIYEVLLSINDAISSITLFTSMAGNYLTELTEAAVQTRNKLRSRIEIALAPNDDQNFSLLNSLRQILYSSKQTGTDINQYLANDQQQSATTPGTSDSQSASTGDVRYTFTEAINKIAEYSKLIYEIVGSRLGLLTTDTGTSSEFTSVGLTTTPILDALNRISNQLTQWYESLMSYVNALTGNTDSSNALAEAGANSSTSFTEAISNISTILTDFYRVLEEKQQRMADYYQLEGVDGAIPDKMQLIQEMIMSALSDRISALNFDNESITGLVSSFGTTIADTIGDRLGISADGTQQGINVSRSTPPAINLTVNGTTIDGVTYVTVTDVRKLVEDIVYDPAYTSEISISALETLRRDPGARSVILG